MAHPQQQAFFDRVKAKYPEHFRNATVIDFGSLDFNGSLRGMFVDCRYVGVDIHAGKNVDVISKAHEYKSEPVDTIVSGEMLEHDEHWLLSLLNMYQLLKPGGLLAISAAGIHRPEHGTERSKTPLWGTNPHYYRNVSEDMLKEFIARLPASFREYKIEFNEAPSDIYFYGIK